MVRLTGGAKPFASSRLRVNYPTTGDAGQCCSRGPTCRMMRSIRRRSSDVGVGAITTGGNWRRPNRGRRGGTIGEKRMGAAFDYAASPPGSADDLVPHPW